MAKALTARTVSALKGDDKRREIPDGGLSGLFLVIQPSGSKSWAVRYRAGPRTRKLTLGSYPTIMLADARRLAREALMAVTEGRDPASEKGSRREHHERNTVQTLVEEFLRRHASKNRTAAEVERIFKRDVLPFWGKLQVDDITRRDVIELVEGIVDRGAPIQANRVLANVRKFFNWCVERDIIDVAPTLGVRPPGKVVRRDRVLSSDELRWFWAATEELGWAFGPIYRLLLLTATRRTEVAAMTWDEISGDKWTIPAHRAKNGRSLTLKLAHPALAILEDLPRMGAYVFTTTGNTHVSGYSKTHQRLCTLMLQAARRDDPDAEIPNWTLHDLRRTAATGMARLGVPLPVVERVLNHVSGSFGGIVGVYQHHAYEAEMADALERWAASISRLVSGGNVIPLSA